MNNLENNSPNSELAVDVETSKAGISSQTVGTIKDKKEKIIKLKKGYLSWKTLFLLFAIFRILAHFSPKDSIFFAPLSLLWGICLALAIIALITSFLSPKKSTK